MAVRKSGAVLAVLLACMTAACQQQQTEAETAPRPIAWVTVEAPDGAFVRSLPGTVTATQTANLSFEVGGRVETVSVEVGDRFQKGNELARLQPKTYRLAVRERRSELAEAQARLAEAAGDFARQEKLSEDGWSAKTALEAALARRNSARSRVEMARARLEIAEEQLADTMLIAPYDGVLAERLIEPSQQVAAGATALEIQGEDGGMEVRVAVPETLIDRLEVGARHRLGLPTRPGLELIGTIREIGARSGEGNAFPVTLHLPESPPGLRAGITAEVDFALEPPAQHLIIPASAFLPGPRDTAFAYVFDPDTGRLSRREVDVAGLEGEMALVRSGLKPGEIIAARGLPFLSDGQEVARLGVDAARYEF